MIQDKKSKLKAFERFLEEQEALERAQASKPVSELWAAWEPTMVGSTRWRTIKAARRFLDISVPWEGGSFTIASLDAKDVTTARCAAWLKALATTKKKRGEGVISNGTQYQVRLAFHCCIKFHPQAFGGENPLKAIKWQAKPGTRVGYFPSLLEQDRFLSCFPPVAADMLRLSRCGGLRRSEMLNLKKTDVDHGTKELNIRRKGGKIWTVILTDEGYDIIVKWSAVAPGEYIFPNPRDPAGGRIPEGTYQSWMKQARKRYGKNLHGGQPPTTHILRHDWFLRNLTADNPASLNHIAEQAGLKSVAPIIDTYGRMRGPEAREAFRSKQNATMSVDVGKKR